MIACSISVAILKFVGLPVQKTWRTSGLSISALVGLVTLTFDLETGAHYCPWSGQPSYQFWYLYDVSFSTYRPTPVRRVMWPCDLDLWCLRSRRLLVMLVSYSVCLPSLKLVGLRVRKIWRTSSLSISRPGDLDLWPLTLKLVRIIFRKVYNLPTNFGLYRTFRSRLIGQHLSNSSRDLEILTFDLGGHGACGWCGSFYSVCVPTTKFEFRRPSRSDDIGHLLC